MRVRQITAADRIARETCPRDGVLWRGVQSMASSDPKLKTYTLTALGDVVGVQFSFAIKDIDAPVTLATSSLASVSDAIRKDRITVLSFSQYGSTVQAAAAYKNENDTMYIPDDYVSRPSGSQRTYDYGTVIHEAVHACFDLMAAKHLTHATGEAAAYLVAALYYEARHWSVKPGNDTFTQVLLEASRLTAKVKGANVTLTRPDFKDLRDAVMTHYKRISPGYRGDTIMSLGVAAAP
jgi:hypothetical protein